MAGSNESSGTEVGFEVVGLEFSSALVEISIGGVLLGGLACEGEEFVDGARWGEENVLNKKKKRSISHSSGYQIELS